VCKGTVFWSALIAWTTLASRWQEIVEGWIALLVLDDFDKDLTGFLKPVRSARVHSFADNFYACPYSSYRAILPTKSTREQRDGVLEWFDSVDNFSVILARDC